MIIIILIHFLLVITNSNGQKKCNSENPFRISDNGCESLKYICFKTGDPQCDELQNACTHCPPGNITLITLQNILNIIQSQFHLISDCLKSANKTDDFVLEIKNLVDKKNTFSISLSILIILIILLILAIIYLAITKYGKCVNGEQANPSLRRISCTQDPVDSEQNPLLQRDLSTRVDLEPEHPLRMRSLSTQENIKVKFKVPQHNKTIQICVNSSHTIIKLKRKICWKIGGLNPDVYKTMIFKYNGDRMDDNQYLLSCLKSKAIPIYCEFCNNIDPKKICVLRIEGKENYPDLLQINRSDTIKDLKTIISKFVNCEYHKLLLYHKSIELKTDKTIEECGLKSDYCINARKSHTGIVEVVSVWKYNKTCPFQYSDDQNVKDFKNEIENKFGYESNSLSLFYDGDSMDENKIIYEYNIEDNCPVEYLHSMNFHNIALENHSIKEYLQIAKYITTKQSILLLKLSLSKLETKEKLLIYHHSKSHHPSLVNIIGIHQKENSVHIAMDDIFTGTLVNYMNLCDTPLLCQIIMWTKQIISGLNYLHENGIYLEYLNPLGMLIDGNRHVKILPFKTDSDQFCNKNNEKIEIKYFVENEILKNKRYPDSQCDVWSLGAILTYIATDNLPIYKLEDDKTGRIKRTCHTLEINKLDPSKYLSDFISSCFKDNLEERLTLDKLMDHKLMDHKLMDHKLVDHKKTVEV